MLSLQPSLSFSSSTSIKSSIPSSELIRPEIFKNFYLNHEKHFANKHSNFRKSLNSFTNKTTSKSSLARASVMEYSNADEKIVDHVVYFKIKPDASPEQVSSMLISLQELEKLDTVIQLTVGESFYSAGGWTHALYGRYSGKSALNSYAVSKEHVDVVNGYVKPIAEEIIAVDWEPELKSEPFVPGITIVHSVIMKFKDSSLDSEVENMIQALRGQEGSIPKLLQISIGSNFSNRSKGFGWGFLALFEKKEDFDAYASSSEHLEIMKNFVAPVVSEFNSVAFKRVEAVSTASKF